MCDPPWVCCCLYRKSEECIIDELEMLHRRCPMGVFSHDEAFYYYGLTDREPLVHEFIEEPGYVKRENLISRISNYDLNERAFIGKYRISEYEVGKINGIYSRSLMILLPAPRCYLYSFIGERARMQKMMSYTMSMVGGEESSHVDIKAYETGLYLPLRLYYFAYLAYTVDGCF